MISRRDFLKMGGTALASAMLAGKLNISLVAASENIQRGRVLYWNLPVHSEPNKSSHQVSNYKFNNLLPIMDKVLGGDEGDYNPWWFKIGHEGYAYSGGIQLVKETMNPTRADFPQGGLPGEVTVPYTESNWRTSGAFANIGSLMYYQTIHWIMGVVADPVSGRVWYRAYDHLYNKEYFLRPQHVRIIPEEEMTPISPHLDPAKKLIEVSLQEQKVRAYEGDRLVFISRAATGKGVQKTPTGWFRTFHKRPSAHMVGGTDIENYYDLPGVPWDTFITSEAVALHGTYWHNDFGTPHSYGCINLPVPAARWIYRWTIPTVPYGTMYLLEPGKGVNVHVIEGPGGQGRRFNR